MSNYGGRTQRLKRLSHSALRQGGYTCMYSIWGNAIPRPRLHGTGTKSNQNEDWNCQHVYVRPVRKSQTFPIYSPCQAIFFFRWLLLPCVVPMSRLQPRPFWNVFLFTFIPVWNHSEFMQVWSQSARSSMRNDLRPVWVIFVPVSCKHLL
jgi:hypothetical protein